MSALKSIMSLSNSLHSSINRSRSIRVMYMSLANAARDEGTDYRLGSRLASIIEYFRAQRDHVDMFLLTEGRICKNATGDKMIDAWDIAYKIAKSLGMISVVMPNNGSSKMAFAKICIYDPTKVFLLESRNYYPGDSRVLPSGIQFDQCLTGLKFHRILPDTYNPQGQCRIDPKLIFNIGFVHTPVRKDGRDEFFRMMIQDFSASHEPWIFPGDYNLFTEDSDEQQQLLDSHFFNATQDIGITFIGYPHDVDKNGIPYQSSLDRVYLNNGFTDIFGDDVQVSAEQVEMEGMRISDHSLLTIDVNFS